LGHLWETLKAHRGTFLTPEHFQEVPLTSTSHVRIMPWPVEAGRAELAAVQRGWEPRVDVCEEEEDEEDAVDAFHLVSRVMMGCRDVAGDWGLVRPHRGDGGPDQQVRGAHLSKHHFSLAWKKVWEISMCACYCLLVAEPVHGGGKPARRVAGGGWPHPETDCAGDRLKGNAIA
jgi:hypothetical protein